MGSFLTDVLNLNVAGTAKIDLDGSGNIRLTDPIAGAILLNNVATTSDLGNYLLLAGGTMAGDINLGTNNIINIGDIGSGGTPVSNIFATNITVAANLTVNGTLTTLNTTNTDIKDQNITLNKGGNDVSAQGAGLTIERTTSPYPSFIWDESGGRWKAGVVGTETNIALISDLSSYLPLTGGTMAGNVSFADTYRITNLVDPSNDQDAATKKWVTDQGYGHGTTNSIKDHADVYNTMVPTNGQILTWDNFNSRWDAANAPGAGVYLPLAGGTMAGAINMGTNIINSIDNLTFSNDGGFRISTAQKYDFQINATPILQIFAGYIAPAAGVYLDMQSYIDMNSNYITGVTTINGHRVLADLTLDSDLIFDTGTYNGILTSTTITSSNKTWTLPDTTGTIALTSELHTQNTDTGTTQTSFAINSGGNVSTLNAAIANTLGIDSYYFVVDDGDAGGNGGGAVVGGTGTGRKLFLLNSVADFSGGTDFGVIQLQQNDMELVIFDNTNGKVSISLQGSSKAIKFTTAGNECVKIDLAGDLFIGQQSGSNGVKLVASGLTSVQRTQTIQDADGTIALTSDIPAAQGLDSVLGTGATATDKNMTLYESGGVKIILETDKTAKTVQIGSAAQNYDIELYGNLNLNSNVTGIGTLFSSASGGTDYYMTADTVGGINTWNTDKAFSCKYHDTAGTKVIMASVPNGGGGSAPASAIQMLAKDDTAIMALVLLDDAGGDGQASFGFIGATGFQIDWQWTNSAGDVAFHIQNDQVVAWNQMLIQDSTAEVMDIKRAGVVIGTGGNHINLTVHGTLNTHTIPGGTGTIALTSALHTQNTDTGTTGDQFIVDSNDDSAIGGGIFFGGTGTGRYIYIGSNVADFNSGAPTDFGVIRIAQGVIEMSIFDSVDGDASWKFEDGSMEMVFGGNTIYKINNDGKLALSDDGTNIGTIDPTSLTGSRTYTLPDANGTFALTSQLHTQNTDTGTTADTFEINNDGNGIILSTTGLTGDRTLTFPDYAGRLVVNGGTIPGGPQDGYVLAWNQSSGYWEPAVAGSGDNLGDHDATQRLNMNNNYIHGDDLTGGQLILTNSLADSGGADYSRVIVDRGSIQLKVFDTVANAVLDVYGDGNANPLRFTSGSTIILQLSTTGDLKLSPDGSNFGIIDVSNIAASSKTFSLPNYTGDVVIDATGSPSGGQVLTWNVSGYWEPGTGNHGTAASIKDHIDVHDAMAPGTTGQLLEWDQGNTRWTVSTGKLSDYLPLSGGTLSGSLDMGTNAISNATTIGASGNISTGANIQITSASSILQIGATGYKQDTAGATTSGTNITTIYEKALTIGSSGKFLIQIIGNGGGVTNRRGFAEYQWVVDGSGVSLTTAQVGSRIDAGGSTADCAITFDINGSNIRVRAQSTASESWTVRIAAHKN